jgi:hypothetical protein
MGDTDDEFRRILIIWRHVMSDDGGIVNHAKFQIRLRPDGIVHVTWKFDAVMDGADAVAGINALSQLTGGRPAPLLVDSRNAGVMTRTARMEFAERSDNISAVAILVLTPLSRIMGNFYLNVSKPVSPTRILDNEEEAVTWLLGYVG